MPNITEQYIDAKVKADLERLSVELDIAEQVKGMCDIVFLRDRSMHIIVMDTFLVAELIATHRQQAYEDGYKKGFEDARLAASKECIKDEVISDSKNVLVKRRRTPEEIESAIRSIQLEVKE